MKHGHVDETLTAGDRAAPFVLADADAEPLDQPTRLACLWDGDAYVEVDLLGAIKAARIAAARTELARWM